MQTIEVSTPTIKVKIGDTELVLTQEEATALRDAIAAAMPKPKVEHVPYPFVGPYNGPLEPAVPLKPWCLPVPDQRERLKYVAPHNPNITVTFCQN